MIGRTPPARMQAVTGGMRVTHREFLGEVTSTGSGFNARSYSINPGLAPVFPWLAPIANRYETYKLRRLVFHYVASCPTSTSGLLMMALDYDAADALPASQSEMLNMNDKTSGPAWSNTSFVAALREGDKSPSKYTRSGVVPNTDIKTYDVGSLVVGFQGVSAATIGILYVEYVVDLFTPQMSEEQESAAGSINGDGTEAGDLFGTPIPTGAVPATANANTLTFTVPWQGVLSVSAGGTVVTGIAVDVSYVTDATELISAAGTSGLEAMAVYAINAAVGDHITITVAATTYLFITAWFAEGPYANFVYALSQRKKKKTSKISSAISSTTSSSSSTEKVTSDSLIEAIEATKQATAVVAKLRSASQERKRQ